MKCMICKHGETRAGTTAVTLLRGEPTIVFKEVPAQVCMDCSEAYVSDEIGEQVFSAAGEANLQGVQVDVRDFQASPA